MRRETAAFRTDVPGVDVQPATGVFRLLTGARDLVEHLERHGPVPETDSAGLLNALDRSALTDRGGAGHATGRRIRALARAAAGGPRSRRTRGCVVVADYCDGDPSGRKDAALLEGAAHLVLDGLVLAARVAGARRAYVFAPAADRPAVYAVRHALTERRAARTDPPHLELRVVESRWPVGSERSLARLLARDATATASRSAPGAHAPAEHAILVENVETLAHVALIARYGPRWFRSEGAADTPGTGLVTLTGAVDAPGVHEIPLGIAVSALPGFGGTVPRAVLVGGCQGAWLAGPRLAAARLSGPGLLAVGGAIGDASVFVLPEGACGLEQTAILAAGAAARDEGRCGPCFYRMSAIADSARRLTQGHDPRAADELRRILRFAAGRDGSCHRCQAGARMILSAMQAFAADVHAHTSGLPCAQR